MNDLKDSWEWKVGDLGIRLGRRPTMDELTELARNHTPTQEEDAFFLKHPGEGTTSERFKAAVLAGNRPLISQLEHEALLRVKIHFLS